MALGFGVTMGLQVEPSETDVDRREVVVELQSLLQMVFGLLVFATGLQGQCELNVRFGSFRILREDNPVMPD